MSRVESLTSSAVLTGQRLLERSGVLEAATRALELGMTGLFFIAVAVLSYGSLYTLLIPTQVNTT